jgi:hypothetical protein
VCAQGVEAPMAGRDEMEDEYPGTPSRGRMRQFAKRGDHFFADPWVGPELSAEVRQAGPAAASRDSGSMTSIAPKRHRLKLQSLTASRRSHHQHLFLLYHSSYNVSGRKERCPGSWKGCWQSCFKNTRRPQER